MTVRGGTAALRSVLSRRLAACLRRPVSRRAAEFTVLLTGDSELRSLNRRYRGKDEVTDVLSFGADGANLGDVAISVPALARKSRNSGLSVADEALTLAVHGRLHLGGMDHATVRGYASMRRAEESLLARHRLRSGLERAAEEVE